MHYYQFNIGDYSSHTGHLDPIEDIAYRRMLDYCYLNEIGLPETTEEIARLIRMRSQCECIATVLQEFFEKQPDGTWRNDRAEREIAAFHGKSGKAAEAARKRWENAKRTHSERIADAVPTHSEGNANHKPRTINQEPIEKDVGADAPDYSVWFAEFWSTWPTGFGEKGSRKNAEAAFRRIKPDEQLFATMILARDAQAQAKAAGVLAGGAFVSNFKHVERWLKGRCWEDEIVLPDNQATPVVAHLQDRSWAD